MAQPYIGEIRMFAGNFAPAGWAFCSGQLLPISENEALYQLIGTMYGGDGQENFALPDLRGRLPLHFGSLSNVSYPVSQAAGVDSVTLTSQQIPVHTHPMVANAGAGTSNAPMGNVLGASATISMYRSTTPNTALANNAIGPIGGSQPHDNHMPYLCVNFILSLFGLFPSPT